MQHPERQLRPRVSEALDAFRAVVVHSARRYARRTGQEFHLDSRRGKGSHARLYVGRRFTTLRRGELSKGMLAAMLRQLGIDGKEL